MKRTLLALAIGTLLACPVLADDSTTNTPPSGPPPDGEHHHGGPGGPHDMKFLTDAEKAEMHKAHDAAIAADPSLATEEEALRADHKPGTPPTDEQKEKMHAFRDKMDAAMIKADPAVEPVIEKIKAHHHGPGGPGGDKDGPPPPPPAQ